MSTYCRLGAYLNLFIAAGLHLGFGDRQGATLAIGMACWMLLVAMDTDRRSGR